MSDRLGPQCPSCGSLIEQMDLRKSFLFVDGVRHVADLSWVPSCCGAIIIDEDFGFSTIEILDDELGPILHSTLRDDNGAEIMSWWDQPVECECEEEWDVQEEDLE